MNYSFFSAKGACVLSMCLFGLFFGCQPKAPQAASQQKTEQQAISVAIQSDYLQALGASMLALDSLSQAKHQTVMLKHYLSARQHFKYSEAALAFFDKSNYKSLNAPNILKVDEEDLTNVKILSPFGFQVLEEQLFETPIDTSAIYKNARLTKARLKMVADNTDINTQKHHLLWMIRDGFMRIAFTGITGFDSPVLAQSLTESIEVYEGIKDILAHTQPLFSDSSLYQKWVQAIHASQQALDHDFDTFDRYAFIKTHTHPQLELWTQTVADWQVDFPFELAIRNDAHSLFSKNTFNIHYFSDSKADNAFTPAKAALGKQLFLDPNLSKDKNMSCASCHQADKALSDGLAVFPKQTRNTPTLLYAALQKGFFHDARSGSLEGQVTAVVENVNEFHTDLSALEAVVANDSLYRKQFKTLYNKEVNEALVRNALAHYTRSLMPFNSTFDRNINGLEHTLSEREINGFNLFMGKAACATCHFPATFNGTVPPHYKDTELELIGVPESTASTAGIDDDLGRYYLFETEERKHFFKTPSIRNISLTAPYMHNGVYQTLEEVMEFYNNGGAAGLGIHLEHQTLPTDSLHLSPSEVEDIILFMESLEDEEY